jgi:hypothetical protein
MRVLLCADTCWDPLSTIGSYNWLTQRSIHVTFESHVIQKMATPVKVIGTAQLLTESTDFELVCFICHVENTVNYKSWKGGFCWEAKCYCKQWYADCTNTRIPTTVCRNCYAKTVSTYNFLKNVRNCASKHAEQGDLRVKRCASSPFTPKISAINSSDDKPPAHRSRKQLKLGPYPQEDQDAPVDRDPTYVV